MYAEYGFDQRTFVEAFASANATRSRPAAQGIRLIEHANVGLWERCDGLETLNALVAKGTRIYTVVLADGFDFDAQILSAVHHISQDIMSNATRLNAMHPEMQQRIIHAAKIALPLVERAAKRISAGEETGLKLCASRKTSSAGQCHSAGTKLTLPPEHAESLAGYYEGDYDILDRLQHIGCHGRFATICRAALASIVAGRPPAAVEPSLPTVEVVPGSANFVYKGGRWLDAYFTGINGPAKCARYIQSKADCNPVWFSHRANDGKCWCAPQTVENGLIDSLWTKTELYFNGLFTRRDRRPLSRTACFKNV